MDDKIKFAKEIAKFVIGTSAGGIATKFVRSNITTKNQLEVIQAFIGAYAIGGMVGDRAVTWAEPQIDAIIVAVQKIKATLK